MNTSPVITIHLAAVSTCTQCGKRVELRRELTEEQLTTGNTTQMASYHARDMKAEVSAAIVGRGWTNKVCGACRDGGPVAVVGESQGKRPEEQRGDDDCG